MNSLEDTKVFSYCNLSFRQIIALVWCWQHKCSIGEITKNVGVSYPNSKSLDKAPKSLSRACKRTTGWCYRSRHRNNAEDFIKQAITPGSIVLTDGFTGYNELASLGYEWLACNHSKGFFGPANHIENSGAS